MTAKEYLQKIKDLEKNIAQLNTDIQNLADMATSITQTMKQDAVQSSGSQQRMADAVTAMVYKKEMLAENIELYLSTSSLIKSQIDDMPKRRIRDLLWYRYVEGLTFEKIAVEMDLSWRHVIRLHGTALKEFAEKYSDFF